MKSFFIACLEYLPIAEMKNQYNRHLYQRHRYHDLLGQRLQRYIVYGTLKQNSYKKFEKQSRIVRSCLYYGKIYILITDTNIG